MGLLTGRATGPSIFDETMPVTRLNGLLGNVNPLPVASRPAPVAPQPQPDVGMRGNLPGRPTPMGGSRPQPQPVPAVPDTNGILDMLAQIFGAQQGQRNWLEQQRNPNGVPFQSQAGRPETLMDFYGPHGISPTATFATAASPINYMGLFGASDPYWGSNAMPGRFPVSQSPMMQMESALRGTPYEQYAFGPYMDRVRGPGPGGVPAEADAGAIADAIRQYLTYPGQYNNSRDPADQAYDPDMYAGG